VYLLLTVLHDTGGRGAHCRKKRGSTSPLNKCLGLEAFISFGQKWINLKISEKIKERDFELSWRGKL
jgi:hypothetical protein